MFSFKRDALRQYTWMKMLDRTVALYDFEGSLLEKHGDEDMMAEFDHFVQH